jgi:hypothetical protein
MTTTILPVREDVAWVCALALGLGYAAKSDAACAQELLEGARGSVSTLRQARESLNELAVTDPDARQRTCRLLEQASRIALARPDNDVDPVPSQTPAPRSDSGP